MYCLSAYLSVRVFAYSRICSKGSTLLVVVLVLVLVNVGRPTSGTIRDESSHSGPTAYYMDR